MKILFICRENVGRSQMAEAIFKQLNDKHEILSAGTKVVSKDGESRHGQILKDLPAAENVILVLKEKGIQVAENTRTQLSPDLVAWADKIIVMAVHETIPDYLLKSQKVIYWKIIDPKGTPLDAHRQIMVQIEDLVRKFMKTILVDAVHCFVSKEGEIFKKMYDLLETYPNKKIIITGANEEEFKKFKLDKMPYEVFTLKHSPEKTNPRYYEILLSQFDLAKKEVVYFEHNPEAVKSSQSLGIETYFYDNDKKDLEGLKKFLDKNLTD